MKRRALSGTPPRIAVDAVSVEGRRVVDEAQAVPRRLERADRDLRAAARGQGVRHAQGEGGNRTIPGVGNRAVARQEDLDRLVEGAGHPSQRPRERVHHVAEAARLGPRLALGGDEDDAHEADGTTLVRGACRYDRGRPGGRPVPCGALTGRRARNAPHASRDVIPNPAGPGFAEGPPRGTAGYRRPVGPGIGSLAMAASHTRPSFLPGRPDPRPSRGGHCAPRHDRGRSEAGAGPARRKHGAGRNGSPGRGRGAGRGAPWLWGGERAGPPVARTARQRPGAPPASGPAWHPVPCD